MSNFYRKRVFLASISTGHTSYLLAEAESSRGGEYKWGHYMLTMADCRRRIQLEFFLGTIRARRESLRKIDLLIKQLEQFRTALRAEANLIINMKQSRNRDLERRRVVTMRQTAPKELESDIHERRGTQPRSAHRKTAR